MNDRPVIAFRQAGACIFTLYFLFCFVSNMAGQSQVGSLHGQVLDQTGAVIPNAQITIKPANGTSVSAKSDGIGAYAVRNLIPGKYTITVGEQGFRTSEQAVEVAPGENKKLDITLEVFVEEEHVDVQSDAAHVSVNPENNANSLVLSGKDLDALSDDPDELQAELQALAGPSAGPNGGQIYIDGFTGGQLPPKSSIREIRINQNPFSAEYDRMGYGRIEILTKPGTDQFHGQVFVNDNHSALDSKSFFATNKPDFDSQIYNGNLSGPLSKHASFFFTAQRRNINEVALVNATVLGSSLNEVPFNVNVPNPRIRTSISPRFDFQLGANNTLTARYQFTKTDEQNAGVGQFALPTQAFNEANTEHEIQLSDTQILGPHVVNETRFEYERARNNQNSLGSGPTISVLGAFTGGSNSLGFIAENTDHYELQNYTSVNRGTHFMRFGGRLRATHQANSSTQGFNGTFTFTSLQAFALGQPSQFSIVTGNPAVSNTIFDAGIYAEDDWRFRQNMTLSYGLRYETQNDINDHADWAPRLGFAWGLGGKKGAQPKTVIRTGFGIFYDRFEQNLVLQAERLNGVNQQQFIIQNPDFYPKIPPLSSLAGLAASSPTTFRIAGNLRAPYTIQSAVSVERQVTKTATATLTYIHSRGVHQLVTINANAPLDPADPNSRPIPGAGNIYQYTSGADFKENQLMAHLNVRAGQKLLLFSFYSLSYANSDTGGASSFASNSNDISADYGRASFDVRSRLFFGGSVGLPHGFRVSPFMIFSSGAPFDITTGTDLNNDSIFNDRPSFATDLTRPSVVKTAFGTFDTAPIPGQTIIPVNFGDGPGQFTFNLRLAKTIGIGPKLETAGNQEGPRPGGPHPGEHRGGRGGGPGGRGGGPFSIGSQSGQRYSITFSANARNLFNFVNRGLPIGNLSSPLFGQSNSLAGGPFNTQAANRRVDLQMMFSF
jgi:Carboxypeptidase regulatory-like domain